MRWLLRSTLTLALLAPAPVWLVGCGSSAQPAKKAESCPYRRPPAKKKSYWWHKAHD
ncbi:MAG: hypothetical protein R3B72_48975 [Polyangiaceae bacterium]